MKKIRLFASALLVAMSVSAFAAENLVCEGLVTRPQNNNCAYGGTFAWTANNCRNMRLFTFEAGTLSNYDKIKITGLKNAATSGAVMNIVYYYDDNSSEKTFTHTFYNANDKDITIVGSDAKSNNVKITADDVAKVTEIWIGGPTDAGSIFVTPANIKLYNSTTNDELVCKGITAREESKSQNASYTANQFLWTASSANTIQLFAFEEGTLSAYKSLTFTTSDFSGIDASYEANTELYRVMFYAGSTKVKNLEKKYDSTGTKKIVLSDIFTDDEIASVTEIVFGGVVAKGILTINPSDIYLTPKATTPTAIDEAKAAAKAVKIIENGQVFIIRDGVRYNALGQVVK